MKVISVNVAQPKEIDWRGQKVSTSIFKLPVEDRRHVGKLNIEGDAQADLAAHGGEHRAIFVYQKDSYDYWRKELHIEDLRYGQFGENLTVEGLADNEVCIGDRFQIGTAVFEVTQPRVTCYKVGISTGVPEMPALLVSHKRPGFYFRVIREGEVAAGDPILKLCTGAGAMTVAEVDGLLYSNTHPADRLLQALHIDALSEGWRGSFQALYQSVISGADSGNAGLAISTPVPWEGFLSFRVNKVVRESESVRSFELSPDDGRSLPAFSAGQHVVVKIPVPGADPLFRMYSLCGPVNKDHYRIGVKYVEPSNVGPSGSPDNGQGSYYLHHHIKAGDHLQISAPRGLFLLSESKGPLVLMGAGIGITPLLAMLYAAANEAPDRFNKQREIWWIYTTQNTLYYPFLDEVKLLSGRIANYHSKTIFSQPKGEEMPGRDFDISGRLTGEALRQLNLPGDGEYYLCGPETYLKSMLDALGNLGIPQRAIKFESFGNLTSPVMGKIPPHLPIGDSGEGPLITFAKSHIRFKWHPRFNNLLEAAEACAIPVSWSCRSGVCHRCETPLFSGEVSYVYPPLDKPANGNVLICCSVPRTAVQLDL